MVGKIRFGTVRRLFLQHPTPGEMHDCFEMCKLKNECLGCWFWHNGKCNAGPGDYCRILKQRY